MNNTSVINRNYLLISGEDCFSRPVPTKIGGLAVGDVRF